VPILIIMSLGQKTSMNIVDSLVRLPTRSERTRSASYYDAPNAPGFDLFPKESDDWLRYEKTPDSPSHVSSTSPLPAADTSGVDKPATTGYLPFLSLFHAAYICYFHAAAHMIFCCCIYLFSLLSARRCTAFY
jgi:hypothetical protein